MSACILQLEEQLTTTIDMIRDYQVNAGAYADDFSGDLDSRIRHNNDLIGRQRRRVNLMSTAARARGDVSMANTLLLLRIYRSLTAAVCKCNNSFALTFR